MQIGLSPRRIAGRLETTQLDYVLRNIAVENNGMLFAVNPSDGTFLSYPQPKLIGREASAYGLTASAVADEYSGDQTIQGGNYFVSSNAVGDIVLSIAVPDSTITSQRLETAIWETLISLVIILLIAFFLVFTASPKTGEAVEKTEKKEGETQTAHFFRILQANGKTRMVQSAASRWNGVRQPWADMTPEQKLMRVMGMCVSLAVLALVIWLMLFDSSLEKGSVISYILSGRWEKGANLFAFTYALITTLEVLVITTVLRHILSYAMTRFGARCETIGRLLDSFIKYAAIIGSAFVCLSAVGVDSTALITSAGILSLVVGLGAQSLIGDIIAGIFIVFEGEFRVGDIVTIGDWRGTVVEIGIRTTKIESAGSDIKIFNNSSISGVINMTKQYSYALCDVGIEYGESLERVESVLQKELPNMQKRLPSIMSGPFYKGVASLGDSSVNIRIIAQCQEKDRVQLTRDMNREMKLIMDKHNINIPFPQIVINQPSEHEKATRREKNAAEAFVEEQKELTKDINVRDDG